MYWKPVWHVLDAVPELELLLANAHAVKNMPGRKTDGDAEWLAQLCECGLLWPVPEPIRGRIRRRPVPGGLISRCGLRLQSSAVLGKDQRAAWLTDVTRSAAATEPDWRWHVPLPRFWPPVHYRGQHR